MAKPTLVIDLDGTLIKCGIYYDTTTARGGEYLASVTGFSPEQCAKTIAALDLVAVSLPDGFRMDRYPTSFEAAALALCHLAALRDRNVIPYNKHMLAAGTIGRQVFDAPYELFPQVKETLAALRPHFQLVLYTKGDMDVQERKIGMHVLQDCFDELVITGAKDAEHFARLLADFDIDPTTSWMIGDSPRDDIAIAQAAGLKTIFTSEDDHTWSYNDADVTPTYTVAHFPEVLALLVPALPEVSGAA